MHYRETAAPASLVSRVQCVWTMENLRGVSMHRVYPDACVDLLYAREGGQSSLQVIGTMTQYRDFEVSPSTAVVGVRLRPGMLLGMVGAPCSDFTDTAADFDSLPGFAARRLKQMLDDSESVEAVAALLLRTLTPGSKRTPVQRAIACIEAHDGVVDLEWVASQANLSERQWRRACHSHTGLTPKQLCRVLRLQHVLRLLPAARHGDLTQLALECGYYDQAHFVRDVREWTGKTPFQLANGGLIV